ncbi:anthranilate synthase component I family protein [Botrimarina mediterranea]|uniref:Aminodeoxychorismate synthase component 1 n=1 Tax=Botrimarina mediterranea TaxID=2528022 RepID=A0A518K8L8_9BACT|nr:anthranilate synthase component I family protein [Botrimarina mediterranea]QDV74141.1 Aminodeoxychorismate synthase component 1 [Botrimarina mediterranea]QDV78772.1 Aminodeoxychorismate synthase component 1 [Planctomycetes bacterium K2D]
MPTADTLAPSDAMTPLVVELDRSLRPEDAFVALAGLPHAVFFDSAMRMPVLGRYSYVTADPFDWLTIPSDGRAAIDSLFDRLNRYRSATVEGLPPWQGGAAGVVGYEVGRSLERLPRPRWDEFQHPALAMGFYDFVVAFDHAEGRAWAISTGLPACGDDRQRRAEWRMQQVLDGLAKGSPPQAFEHCQPVSQEDLAPSFATPYGVGVASNFSRGGYLAAVDRVLEHLRAGDAFQVNLSQRLLLPDPGDPVEMYLRLRERNPAPFGGYVDGGPWQVASASPERFLQVAGRCVETRPIKGTRPLGVAAGAELLASEKDRAENVMIVDLLRNDLSRVCKDDSVAVPTLFGLEPYAHVQHLVSVVTGRLRDECGVADLLEATLPGGSITGAPKVRAQEIIATLEPTARGAYCGAIAWIGFPDAAGRQAMDSSVLIRTLTRSRGWVQAPVGGGVVVQSDPAAEYEETWHKAAGLVDAVAP